MESTDLSFLAEGVSIPEIIVNSTKMMTSGVTQCISEAFDGLVLNQAGTGLSAIAIWCLSFIGVGFIWRLVPKAYRLLRGRR